MKKYNVIVVDDEQLALDVIKNYLDRYPQYILRSTFLDPEAAFRYLTEHDIDLVITDIAMPNLSGLELAKLTKQDTSFILVTSYSEYAIKSFELNVTDYLLKPVSFDRFSKSLERFEASYTSAAQERDSFFIKEGDMYKKIFIHEIDGIRGMKDYAKISCGEKDYLLLKTLTSVESFLAPYNFLRIHKSYIIPLKKIEHFDGKYVKVNKIKYPVGSTYKETLKLYLEKERI